MATAVAPPGASHTKLTHASRVPRPLRGRVDFARMRATCRLVGSGFVNDETLTPSQPDPQPPLLEVGARCELTPRHTSTQEHAKSKVTLKLSLKA